MKKIVLISIIAISMILFVKIVNSQSQRLVLAEEFNQASCDPCAAIAPSFNAFLNANVGKIVPIKYQVNWPGVDPMNTQTQTWVAPRVTLDNVTGVPDALMDGGYPGNVVSGAYQGYPGNFTQSMLDSEYAIPSPFAMTVNFTFTPNYDSVNVKCVYTCTQAVTMITPKLQIAMTEQHIHFATAPGANGETDFYEVMRCMYSAYNGVVIPDSVNGTALKTTWNAGDKDSLIFKTIVPSYIYDKAEIAFVAFIQDNAGAPTFNVKQAAYCAPLPMLLDAAIINLQSVPVMQCSATFTPSIELENPGTTTLNSATISYQIDNGTASTLPWSGSLIYGDSISVALPTITGTNGAHTFTATVSSPNGGTDQNPINNSITKSFTISLATPAATPFTQGFESTTFPPVNWILNNPNNSFKWERSASAGGFGNSIASAYIQFYNIPTGTNDMIAAPIDLSGATKATMTFSVAHAQYSSAYQDELQVLVSTDCGATWTVVYDKMDPALATAPEDSTTEFVPTSTQWRTDTVNLNSYIGQTSVFINFHGITGYGNDVFVDDINIPQVTGIREIANSVNYMNVFPNPFSNYTNIEFSLAKGETASFNVYNLIGEKVLSIGEAKNYGAGTHTITINANDLSQGIYYLNAVIGEQKITQKLIIVK
jgi:hypothetical protein